MAIYARRPKTQFTPCPEGLHPAVCVDVVDLGIQKTTWGEKHQVELRWQIEDRNPATNKRFDVRKWYTLSLHEKASLRKDLECWRGRKFTDDEADEFDLEKLLGANCQLQVIHTLGGEGTVYANVQAIVPQNKKMGALRPEDYIRQKDRDAKPANGGKPEDDSEPDDSVPF